MSSLQSSPDRAQLQTTLCLLQEELEATNHEVMMLTLDLEQRVAERTVELSKANRELRNEIAERLRAEQEIKQLNKDLHQRAELLAAANEELEAFSSSVSHDLRNPLATVLAYAEMVRLNARATLGPRDQEYLDRICSTGMAMSSLIDDLLRLSHASHAELVWTSVDMNQLVETILSELEQVVKGRNIIWKRPPLPVVSGDAALLKQALINLISNALKYSRNRNPAEIEIATEIKDGEEWIFVVRDNGVGFDPAGAGKLFGAFQRLHDKRDFEGTGIGLANVRRIILRHGGRIWAEGKPGIGAIFYFSLPMKILH
jgi:hypothetical protein